MLRVRDLFFADEIIAYQTSCWGVLLNIVIGFIRAFVFLPTCLHWVRLLFQTAQQILFAFSDFHFNYLYEANKYGTQSRYTFMFTIIDCVASFVVLFDCCTATSKLTFYADFRERIKLARFAYWCGLGGHVGLVLVRMMLWGIVMLSMNFDACNAFDMYLSILDGDAASPAMFLFSVHQIVLASVLYLIIALTSFLKDYFCLEFELSHPWLESYVLDPETKDLRPGKWTNCGTAVMCINIVYYMFMAMSFVSHIGRGTNTADLWEIQLRDYQDEIFVVSLICGLTLRLVYLTVRRVQLYDVPTSFMLIGWFMMFVISHSALKFGDDLDDQPELSHELHSMSYLTALVLFLNVLYGIVCFPKQTMNLFFYIWKQLLSVSFVVCLLEFALVIMCCLTLAIGVQAYNQEWFDMDVEFCPVLKAIANVIYQVVNSITSVLSFFEDAIFDILNSTAMEAVICIIITVLVATLLVMLAIGCGLGAIPYFAKKIATIVKQMTKAFKSLYRLKRPILKVLKYTHKVFKVVKAISKPLLLTLPVMALLFFTFLCSIPFITAFMGFTFFMWERKSVNGKLW
eukprot:3404_1